MDLKQAQVYMTLHIVGDYYVMDTAYEVELHITQVLDKCQTACGFTLQTQATEHFSTMLVMCSVHICNHFLFIFLRSN